MPKNSIPQKFLPVCRSGLRAAFPIVSLDPDSIRGALDNAKERCPPETQPNTLLNGVARGFFPKKWWAEYRSAYEQELRPFLEKHGLTDLRCLLPGEFLTYRQVADRFFASGLERPTRLFTGLGFDYWQLLELAAQQIDLTVRPIHRLLDVSQPDRQFPPNAYHIHSADAWFSYADTLVFSNLIGDQLCDYVPVRRAQDFVARIYPVEGPEAERYRKALPIFHRLIMALSCGWVRVIPFNDNLVFLADGTGGYDFVFRNLRDRPSPSSMGGGPLTGTSKGVDEDQAFLTKHYFEYEGWQERDEHESEREFYESGGTSATYPGPTTVLRRYLERYGNDAQAVGVRRRAQSRRVQLTDLVSIREFRDFRRENDEHARRYGCGTDDLWFFANGGGKEDDSLPVSVTWEGAAAYARWYADKGHHSARLPTEDDYRETFTHLIPGRIAPDDVIQALQRRLVVFEASDGTRYDGHPPSMTPEEFARLTVRYCRPVPMEEGLVRSAYFGEWLEPAGAAINGLFFCAQPAVASAAKCVISPSRDRFPIHTTGKYKSMKIGFRLALLE